MKGEEVLNILSSNPSTIEKCPKMKERSKKVSLGIEIFFDLNFFKSFVLCRQKIELEDVPSNSKSIFCCGGGHFDFLLTKVQNFGFLDGL